MRVILFIAFLFLFSCPAWSATWYINATTGGTGVQCDGHTDHALAGASGTNCQLNSLYWVFVLQGGSNSTTRQASGGDTIVVEGSDQGSAAYRIGCQNSSTCADATLNLTRSGPCSEFSSYGCVLGTIPSGPSAAVPTTVIGCTASGCGCSSSFSSTTKTWSTTCTHPRPELWGAGRAYSVLDVHGSSNISIQDLEIDDHAAAGEGHPTLDAGSAGGGNQPTVLYARIGVYQLNSQDISYKNLNIHGLTNSGFYGGSVGNHIYDNVRVFGNGLSGINYDNCGNDGTCGVTDSTKTMVFKNGTSVTYNGCVESTTAGTIQPAGCYDQNNSGYGDGVGGTNTSGTWTITDSEFSHNTSDGFDMLYINRTGKTGGSVSVKRSLFEGNVGDGLKTDSNVTVEDSYIIGNCQYFSGATISYGGITDCRGGYAIAVANNVNSGTTTAKYYNNTITSNFDVMFGAGSSGVCQNSFTIEAKNNVLMGGADFQGGDSTQMSYSDCGSNTMTFSEDYNTCTNNFKDASPCPGAHSKNNVTTVNTFAGTIKQGTVGTQTTSTYYMSSDYVQQLTLKSTSTAIGAANASLAGTDSYGYGLQDRGVIWDMGALDYAAASSPVCGNGSIESGETCDDSNAISGDGCNSTCTAVESGWTCSGSPSSCSTTCGDSIIAGTEQCDDGNTTSGDGCSATCQTEGSVSALKVKAYGVVKISGGMKFQ